MQKSFVPKDPGAARSWKLMDATDRPVGRLAVKIANALRGKDRPSFDPSIDTGDFVIVLNADKVRLTGRKLEQKQYMRYSGYRAGLRSTVAATMLEKHPDRVILEAVWGMLPKNNISRKLMTRVRVYRGAEHPHAAQKPEVVEF